MLPIGIDELETLNVDRADANIVLATAFDIGVNPATPELAHKYWLQETMTNTAHRGISGPVELSIAEGREIIAYVFPLGMIAKTGAAQVPITENGYEFIAPGNIQISPNDIITSQAHPDISFTIVSSHFEGYYVRGDLAVR